MTRSTAAPIVVGVALNDRDHAPIALGRVLADLTGRRLDLVHAYPYEPAGAPSREFEASLRENARAGLAELAAGLPSPPELAVHAVRGGSPARGLHTAAERLGAAALVIGSTHRGRIGHVLPGGVGERLLHGAPCALAVAPHGYAGQPGDVRRIGVAVDGGPESIAALDAAIALARPTGMTVSVYTVSRPVDVASTAALPIWTAAPGFAAARHAHAEQVLHAARERVPADVRGEIELLIGQPSERLAHVSATLDLLVCGSRGYGPLRVVLLGGVSVALARTAACPLLVVPRSEGPPLAGSATA